MVVLRCVPCLACMGIDSAVLKSTDLDPLLSESLARVRANANSLDFARFQFDYDLSFSTLFFNGDGTLYGRFGSRPAPRRTPRKPTSPATVMRSKRRWRSPGLSGEPGQPGGEAGAGDAVPRRGHPGLAGKYQRKLDWDGKVLQSCRHRHQIGDALRTLHRQRDGSIPPESDYPAGPGDRRPPGSRPTRRRRWRQAAAGSAKGWVPEGLLDRGLWRTAAALWRTSAGSFTGRRNPVAAAAEVEREGRREELRLVPEWAFLFGHISRTGGHWGNAGDGLRGLQLVDLGDDERRERGLDAGGMALLVLHAGETEPTRRRRGGLPVVGHVLVEVGDCR